MTLGQKIRMLRVQNGLTQKDLADNVHVTFQTVSKWENNENEPDIATLKQLAKLFNCSIGDLLSEEDAKPTIEEEPPEEAEPVTKTIIIHQKELHVCERCKKDIPEDQLEMEEVCVRHGSRGRSAQYRQAYYHKECLEQTKKERAEEAAKLKAYKASESKKKTLTWSIVGAVVFFTVALLVFLFESHCKAVIHPALAVLYAVLIGVAIFMDIYCILSGSYIGEVFIWCSSLSIKFPGLIFSWDIDGLEWVIVMKITFAILGFLIGLFALGFAIAFSAVLSVLSFPFIVVHNRNNTYIDSIFQ